MKIERCVKESFVVIGKEGSSISGNGFVKKLWKDTDANFNEIVHLAKKDDKGNLLGVWGAMSDFTHSFKPWENNFSEGLYLAGVECNIDVEAPKGWAKWIVPGYEYLHVASESDDTFFEMIMYLKENNIPLVGAVHDFKCLETGQWYMFFPIKKL